MKHGRSWSVAPDPVSGSGMAADALPASARQSRAPAAEMVVRWWDMSGFSRQGIVLSSEVAPAGPPGVLRLADIYLLYAEAIMEGAQSTQNLTAIRAYNAVRDRVGLPTLAVDGSASLTLDDLLYERRMELAFENHRFYDLIRTGKAIDILGNFASTYGFRFSSTDLLLPIPQEEINVSRGLLSQNPGYN